MGTEPKTLNELFNSAVDRHRESEFLRFKAGGVWRSLTFGEVARRVRELALGLYALGIRSGDRVAIWSENRPEWNLADLAALAIGAVDVPIYATQARTQVEYILADSAARAIFVPPAFAEDALAIKSRLPALEFVISLEEASGPTVGVEHLVDKGRALYGEQPGLYEHLHPVHIWFHRRSQRRDADAQEPGGQRVEQSPMASFGRQARTCADVPAVHPHLRARSLVFVRAHRRDDRVRGEHRHGCEEPDRNQPDGNDQRTANVREDLREDNRARALGWIS